MSAVTNLRSPTTEVSHLEKLIADTAAWNHYAARMNAKAVAAGLVTVEELARNRRATEEALGQLRGRIA